MPALLKDDKDLSERGLHRRERVRLGMMQRELRRLEDRAAHRDIVSGVNDDDVEFSTRRGVSHWPEGEAEFGRFPSKEQFAHKARRVQVEYRSLPVTRRAGRAARNGR
jgi:hypothetical protein